MADTFKERVLEYCHIVVKKLK